MSSSPGGTNSSGSSSFIQNSDETHLDQRKRKRMLSNRESARRSRMRKQKHLDDLMSQVSQLRAQNNQIVNKINVVSQLSVNIESENSVLVAQMTELNQRLQALNDIIGCMNSSTVISSATTGFESEADYYGDFIDNYGMIGGTLGLMNQPIMASVDAFMY